MRRLLPALAVTAILLSARSAAHARQRVLPDRIKIKDADKAQQAGDIAWMLVSTAFVLFMVPGLALFYGGMVRRKNVLGTMMHSMIALSIIGLQWVLFGYSLAFGASKGGWIGWSPEFLGLGSASPLRRRLPRHQDSDLHPLHVPGDVRHHHPGADLRGVRGAGAVRAVLPVHFPLGDVHLRPAGPLGLGGRDADGKPAGWLGQMGALDFAGGTVVHVAAGFAGLAAILCLRKRIGYPAARHAPEQHGADADRGRPLVVRLVRIQRRQRSGRAARWPAMRLTASQVAAAAAGLSWVFVEWLHRGKPTALGLASGIVAGLVAVTPASGFVAPPGALIIGLIAGAVCYGAVCLKPKLKYDDSLDAFGVHGIGGFLGAILTGVFAVELLWQKPGPAATIPLGTLAKDRAGPDRSGCSSWRRHRRRHSRSSARSSWSS